MSEHVCEYAEVKYPKVSRCTSTATTELTVEGQPIWLCPQHAALLKRMMDRKAKLEAELKLAQEGIDGSLDSYHELERLMANKKGESITCSDCHEAFEHSGEVQWQVCPYCQYKNV